MSIITAESGLEYINGEVRVPFAIAKADFNKQSPEQWHDFLEAFAANIGASAKAIIRAEVAQAGWRAEDGAES